MAPRAVILTGERDAGKTTLCLALAALSFRYDGLVSPRLFDSEGNRVGIAAKRLATGEEWVLARSDAELDGPRIGQFSFSSAGLERAVDSLRGILTRSRGTDGSAGTGCSPDAGDTPGPGVSPGTGDSPSTGTSPGTAQQPVVIVDEIGPLELEQGAGLAPVLPLLAGAGHLLLVVRPSLADLVEALVPVHRRTFIVVTPEHRASLATAVDVLFD